MSFITIVAAIAVAVSFGFVTAGQIYSFRMAYAYRRKGGLSVRRHLWFTLPSGVFFCLSATMLLVSFHSQAWAWVIAYPTVFIIGPAVALLSRDWWREDKKRFE